jgi:hypothetical protein
LPVRTPMHSPSPTPTAPSSIDSSVAIVPSP